MISELRRAVRSMPKISSIVLTHLIVHAPVNLVYFQQSRAEAGPTCSMRLWDSMIWLTSSVTI